MTVSRSGSRTSRIGLVTSWGLAALALGATASCIALIDKNADQCDVDGDCPAKGPAFAGRACVQHVCVAATSGFDSGIDSSNPTDAKVDAFDVGPDAPDVPPTDTGPVADTGPSGAGVFVVSGTTVGGGVLVVIDPETGTELKREARAIVALAYDPGLPTGGGDVWYVFENDGGTLDGGIPANKLIARTFDPASKTWTDIGSLAGVPKPKSSRDVVVMNKRILYLADYMGSDPLGVGNIYLIDVSSPTTPKLVCDGCLPGPANTVTKNATTDKYLGLLAGGRAADTLSGGNLGIGFTQACTDTGGTCPTFFQRYRYTGNDSKDIPGNQASFGSFAPDAVVGIGSSFRHGTAFMAIPDTTGKGKVLQNPQTFFGAAAGVASFDYTGTASFSPIVIAGCEDVAVFTSSNQLLAVPFGSKGFVTTAIAGGGANGIAFDTRTNVVAYYTPSGLKAARVTAGADLTLTSLAWPAIDFAPTAIRGREPGNACK